MIKHNTLPRSEGSIRDGVQVVVGASICAIRDIISQMLPSPMTGTAYQRAEAVTRFNRSQEVFKFFGNRGGKSCW